MAKVAINSVWASNTTNKANMTSEEISRGIILNLQSSLSILIQY